MPELQAVRLGLAIAVAKAIANVGGPQSLYVHRPLLNAAEVRAWAKVAGFPTTLPPDDMHVTVAYSKRPIDWLSVGESWEPQVEVTEGGPRQLAVFGEGAIVLQFASNSLRWRHRDIREAGASWDWPDYRPHVTLSYAPDFDIAGLEAYQGKLTFGPEKFEPINEDWQAGVKES